MASREGANEPRQTVQKKKKKKKKRPEEMQSTNMEISPCINSLNIFKSMFLNQF